MSKYTTEVRFICETASGLEESKGYSDIDTILNTAHSSIFDFDYPIFDDNYKSVLEKKILKYYYTREICEETVGLWKLRLANKMNEIMPYYNQLYKSELIKFDPLTNVDLDTSRQGVHSDKRVGSTDRSGNNSTESLANENSKVENKQTGWDLYSDTPQGGIEGLENETYLTNARKTNIESDNQNSLQNSSVNKGEYDENNSYEDKGESQDYFITKLSGKASGETYSKMLTEFRNTFLNVDKMVIDELSGLFFGLW